MVYIWCDAILPSTYIPMPPPKYTTFVRGDNCETRSRLTAASRIYLCYTSVLINKHYPHPANLGKSSFPRTYPTYTTTNTTYTISAVVV